MKQRLTLSFHNKRTRLLTSATYTSWYFVKELTRIYGMFTIFISFLAGIAFSSEICLCFLSHIIVLNMKSFVITYLVLIPGELRLVFSSIKGKKSHFRTWVIFFFLSLCYKSKLHIMSFIVVNNHNRCCIIEVWLFLRSCKVYNIVMWFEITLTRLVTKRLVLRLVGLTAQSVETSVTELVWHRERHKFESQYVNRLKIIQ